MRHIMLLVGILATATLFTACGEGGTTTPNGNGTPQPQVATVEVTPAADTFWTVGRTGTLTAVAKDASGNTLTKTFAWTSSNSAVTVSNAGMVTAQENGTATVTATTDEISGSATILVEQVVASVEINFGDSVTAQVLNLPLPFSATALDSLNNVVRDAALSVRDDFDWSASDSTVATPTASGRVAQVTPLADGTSVITASMDGAQDSVSVVVAGVMSLDWMFEVGASLSSDISAGIVGTPGVAPDGTLYLGAMDGKVYAINPDGSQKWAFDTGTEIWSSPAIATDGTVYVGAMNGTLYALNPDGSIKWTLAEPNTAFSPSPAIGPHGTIYIGSTGGTVYAVNPDGTKHWEYDAQGFVWSSAAIGLDSTIYFGSETGALTALNPDGSVRWQFATGSSDIISSPAIGADGTIYFGAWDATLYAVNPDGSSKWSYGGGSRELDSSPTIATDGTVYLGHASGGDFHAVNPDGTQKWAVDIGNVTLSSPAIDADGTIYVGASTGIDFAAIDPGGTLQLGISAMSDVFSSPVIATDGTVYIGSAGGVLYAFSPLAGAVGPMNSAWPKFRHDLRNTGYVGTP